MKPRWRLVLFLAVLFCVLLTQSGRPHVIKQRLRDGSTLSLVRITHGTEHRYVHGTFFALIFPLLPDWARGEMGQRWDSITTPTECDVAWFALDPPGGSWAANPLKIDSYTLFDEDGCEIRSSTMNQMFGPIIGNRMRHIGTVVLSPTPRRTAWVGVRFWEARFNAPAASVADFVIAFDKPPTMYRSWDPSPLPSTTSSSGAKWRLRSLETNVPGQWENYGAATSPNRRATVAHLERKGTSDVEPVWLRFADATGEVLDQNPHLSIKRMGEIFKLRSPGTLWQHEKAYDVEVALSRTATAQFGKDELRTVTGMPVSPAAQAKRPYRSFPDPRRFQMGSQEAEISSPDWSFRGPPELSLHFFVKDQAWPWSRIVVTRIEDDQGRNVELAKDGYVRYTPFFREGRLDTSVEIPVLIKKPAKTLTVTFALGHPKVVRFRVKPTRWLAPSKPAQAKKDDAR